MLFNLAREKKMLFFLAAVHILFKRHILKRTDTQTHQEFLFGVPTQYTCRFQTVIYTHVCICMLASCVRKNPVSTLITTVTKFPFNYNEALHSQLCRFTCNFCNVISGVVGSPFSSLLTSILVRS